MNDAAGIGSNAAWALDAAARATIGLYVYINIGGIGRRGL